MWTHNICKPYWGMLSSKEYTETSVDRSLAAHGLLIGSLYCGWRHISSHGIMFQFVFCLCLGTSPGSRTQTLDTNVPAPRENVVNCDAEGNDSRNDRSDIERTASRQLRWRNEPLVHAYVWPPLAGRGPPLAYFSPPLGPLPQKFPSKSAICLSIVGNRSNRLSRDR